MQPFGHEPAVTDSAGRLDLTDLSLVFLIDDDDLRAVIGMLDSLFGYKFPYMMCMYNEPVNSALKALACCGHFKYSSAS